MTTPTTGVPSADAAPAGAEPAESATVRSLMASATRSLGSAAEGRWILAHALGVPATGLVTHLDDDASARLDDVRHMVDRRRGGEPLQYVLGTWAFRTLELSVDRRVLVPRPETEQVVEVALDELRRLAPGIHPGDTLVTADLGSGSGAIALSLAAEWSAGPGIPDLEVWATDVSGDALDVLHANLASVSADRADVARRVRTAPGSWFGALPAGLAGGLHLVVSTPRTCRRRSGNRSIPRCATTNPGARSSPARPGSRPSRRSWARPGDGWHRAGSRCSSSAPDRLPPRCRRPRELGYVGAVARRDLAGRLRMVVVRQPGHPPRR